MIAACCYYSRWYLRDEDRRLTPHSTQTKTRFRTVVTGAWADLSCLKFDKDDYELWMRHAASGINNLWNLRHVLINRTLAYKDFFRLVVCTSSLDSARWVIGSRSSVITIISFKNLRTALHPQSLLHPAAPVNS